MHVSKGKDQVFLGVGQSVPKMELTLMSIAEEWLTKVWCWHAVGYYTPPLYMHKETGYILFLQYGVQVKLICGERC